MSSSGQVTPRTFEIRTLGCKANLVDAQLIESDLRRQGWVPAQEGVSADLCVINSCTVTDEADKQSLKTAERLARENPQAQVVMTGCGAEVNPGRWLESGAIHAVVGNQDKRRLVDFVSAKPVRGEILGGVQSYAELRSRHPMDREWALPSVIAALPDQSHDRTRAFLKIQEGCNAFCTYCIIPYGRGPSRSLDPQSVVENVRILEQRGIREVVITGTNIGDYGTERAPVGDEAWSYREALPQLMEALLAATTQIRFRLSSLDPVEISPRLLALMQANSRLCPHFHISLQSPLTKTLRRMKRKYGTEEAQAALEAIAALPTATTPFVGMDVITGFPGETEEDFAESTRLLKSWPWSRLHVFPYSERSGTPATRLDGKMDRSRRVERARAWMQLSTERLQEFVMRSLARSGDQVSGVILEAKRGDGAFQGYSPDYLRLEFARSPESWKQNDLVAGRVLKLRVDRPTGDVVLEAEPLC